MERNRPFAPSRGNHAVSFNVPANEIANQSMGRDTNTRLRPKGIGSVMVGPNEGGIWDQVSRNAIYYSREWRHNASSAVVWVRAGDVWASAVNLVRGSLGIDSSDAVPAEALHVNMNPPASSSACFRAAATEA